MLVEVFCLKWFLNLCVLNDGSSTYYHPASGNKSMSDLSVANPSIFSDLTWTVVDDLHGSENFPVLVQFNQKASDDGILEMFTGIITLTYVFLI